MSKRYKTGTYEAYDNKYVSLKNASQILGQSSKGISFATILFDETNCAGYKTELIGEQVAGEEGKAKYEKGEYVRNHQTYLAKIPMLKQQLREWNLQYRSMQEQANDQGKPVPSFDECPANMLEKRLLIEASIDIATEELEAVNKKLKEYSDVVEAKDDREVLQYGLQQMAYLRDGVVSEIDYQKVEKINGVLCICDPRSPYDNLSVISYREMSGAWIESMKVKDAKILKTMQDAARKAGEVIPRYFSRCHGAVRVPKNLLPPCPDINTDSE